VTTQRIIAGDCIAGLRTLPDASVHCCVTSPPYWGLRDYGHDGQIGLESTPEAYVARMVEVFREVRRVLREDGTCWVNLGDSYASDTKGSGGVPEGSIMAMCPNSAQKSQKFTPRKVNHGLKQKDLVGIPWRVAFALQADGWWLRQDIIWHKPNPMPESVRDRCTKAHEYVFLLTKSERYYYDAEAVSEPAVGPPGGNVAPVKGADDSLMRTRTGLHALQERAREAGGYVNRNRRSVWTVTTKPYSGAHFAVMPPDLVEPCIKAGCPEQCCSVCGSPWVRVVERRRVMRHELPVGDPNYRPGRYTSKAGGADEYSNGGGQAFSFSSTKGWEPSCDCQRMMCDAVMMGDRGVAVSTIPGTVLDPFAGSGTTLAVAAELGRNAIGCELNPEYISLAERRIKDARASVALFEGAVA
jgi:DNA modification methylase